MLRVKCIAMPRGPRLSNELPIDLVFSACSLLQVQNVQRELRLRLARHSRESPRAGSAAPCQPCREIIRKPPSASRPPRSPLLRTATQCPPLVPHRQDSRLSAAFHPTAFLWMTPQTNYRMLVSQLVAAGKATAAGNARRNSCQEDRRAEDQYLIPIACISVRLHGSRR